MGGVGGGSRGRAALGGYLYGRGAKNSGVMPGGGGAPVNACLSCPSWANASPGRLAEIIGSGMKEKQSLLFWSGQKIQ